MFIDFREKGKKEQRERKKERNIDVKREIPIGCLPCVS